MITICSLFCFVTLAEVSAQRNNYWYFGKKAGVHFNTSGGQFVPNAIFNSVMTSDEGSAAVADKNGQLLFYTNGTTVYNRLHEVMVNGDQLKGHISSCQATIIVPQPGNDSIFYIFTADAIENDFLNGYQYSIVDIRRNNGNGEVISKNNTLSVSGTERMTAARHSNGVDVWIITNDNSSNRFRSFLLTCTGLQPAVISISGAVLDQYTSSMGGMMKVSPDGKLLCQTHFPDIDVLGPSVGNFFQLFDFNNNTGVISIPRPIQFPTSSFMTCEFSQDSKLLYVTEPSKKSFTQVECTLPTVAAIMASAVTLPTGTLGYVAIQMAPDEKIYLTTNGAQFLAAINKPNVKGSGCNFIQDQVDLKAFSSYFGLPAFINDIVPGDALNNFTYTIIDSCAGIVQFTANSMMPAPVNWRWDFGDGQQSVLQNPIHTFTPSSKSYQVSLQISSPLVCGEIERSKIVTPNDFEVKLDFDFVKVCDSGYVRFVNHHLSPTTAGQFTWDFGDGNASSEDEPKHTYSGFGKYQVRLQVTSPFPCRSAAVTDTIDLKTFDLTVSPAQTILNGQTIQLLATSTANITTYNWTPSTDLNNPRIRNPRATPASDIVYTVIATDENLCTRKDSVRITVVDPDAIYMPSGFTPNNDGLNDEIFPYYPSKIVLREFSVYNRWGTKIFFTSQRGKGWNGRIMGSLQPQGAYIWILNMTDETGKALNRKGTFVLLR